MYHYYKIADLTVKMDTFGRTADLAFPYRIEPSDHVDITIDPGYQIIKALRPDADDDLCEYLASGRVFYRHLLDFDGIMLHASAVAVDGKAYLFSADSGTGKSTHVGLWRRLLGDERVRIINDDKPALRLENGTWYVYGTPWSGKHDLSQNIGLPVKALCFISRKETNEIQRLSNKDALVNIISQCTRNFKKDEWDLILGYMGEFVNKIPVYRLFCNNELDAAKLSFKTLTEAAL
jgi:hypothetical protein